MPIKSITHTTKLCITSSSAIDTIDIQHKTTITLPVVQH